ncbi:hypothetical protein [Bacillus thuringiensis]|uniref:hypothetical protein n=1 Tax=Bacillus cereus group TaxID=86661 RepID=UPI0002F16779|nr:hypothetical protein [Bacillus thuringiensis]
MKFVWSFTQSFTIRAIVKSNINGGTVLRVTSVKNKYILYSEIIFEHPEIAQSTKVNEPKQYTLQNKKNLVNEQEDIILDEEVSGTTDNFDVIEMNNKIHEYTRLSKIKKLRMNTNKKRYFEDANTRKIFIDSESKQSTVDVGGNQVNRGLEQ